MFIRNWMKGRRIRPFDITPIAILAIFIFVMVRVSYVFPNPIVESSRGMDLEEGALKIQSDEMVLKTREQKIHFKGHVIVRHQEMVLKADHVVLFLKEKKPNGSHFSYCPH